jgi:hypothetical protein
VLTCVTCDGTQRIIPNRLSLTCSVSIDVCDGPRDHSQQRYPLLVVWVLTCVTCVTAPRAPGGKEEGKTRTEQLTFRRDNGGLRRKTVGSGTGTGPRSGQHTHQALAGPAPAPAGTSLRRHSLGSVHPTALLYRSVHRLVVLGPASGRYLSDESQFINLACHTCTFPTDLSLACSVSIDVCDVCDGTQGSFLRIQIHGDHTCPLVCGRSLKTTTADVATATSNVPIEPFHCVADGPLTIDIQCRQVRPAMGSPVWIVLATTHRPATVV